MTQPRSKSPVVSTETEFQKRIVRLIALERKPDEALELLSNHYRIQKPLLRMGLPKGEKRALGCYVQREKTIYISREEHLFDPYVVIHEFYHHLRSVTGKHRGTERHARDFALEFLNTNSLAGHVPER